MKPPTELLAEMKAAGFPGHFAPSLLKGRYHRVEARSALVCLLWRSALTPGSRYVNPRPFFISIQGLFFISITIGVLVNSRFARYPSAKLIVAVRKMITAKMTSFR